MRVVQNVVMASAEQPAPDPVSSGGGYLRDEPKAQRLDRNFGELLQELRVAQAGVQILFAFLLSLTFQARFATVDTFQMNVYLATLLSAALAAICFTGPVAAHRVLFRRGVKDYLVRYSTRAAVAGLVFLAITVIGGVLLVVDVLTTRTTAFAVAGGLVAFGFVVWVVMPFRMRRHGVERGR